MAKSVSRKAKECAEEMQAALTLLSEDRIQSTLNDGEQVLVFVFAAAFVVSYAPVKPCYSVAMVRSAAVWSEAHTCASKQRSVTGTAYIALISTWLLPFWLDPAMKWTLVQRAMGQSRPPGKRL